MGAEPPKDATTLQELDELLLHADELEWRAKTLKGVFEKPLWRDPETGASIVLIRIDRGVGIPEAHLHAANQFMYCLSGRYEYLPTGRVLTAGSFYWNPKGNVHGPTLAHEDTVFLEIFDGPHYPERPSWYSDDRDAR